MNRPFLLVRSWIAIVAIAILAMPMGGAHLHLCFDGGEPPASLHASDDAVHQSAGAAPIHHDVDVQIANTTLGKKVSDSSHAEALLAAAFILLPLPSIEASIVPQQRTDSFVPDAAVRLLPPLRGPPV